MPDPGLWTSSQPENTCNQRLANLELFRPVVRLGRKLSSKVRFHRRAGSKSCIKELPEVLRHEAFSRWDLSLNASGGSVSVDSRICE